jgi:hypothetical protein
MLATVGFFLLTINQGYAPVKAGRPDKCQVDGAQTCRPDRAWLGPGMFNAQCILR